MKYPEFAQRLIQAIKASGLPDTQAELATLFGVSGVMIWSYRNGDKMPRMSTAIRIADALNINVEWLLTGKGQMNGPSIANSQSIQALIGVATPKSRATLEKLNKAAESGQLTEADLLLLEQIAARLAGRAKNES